MTWPILSWMCEPFQYIFMKRALVAMMALSCSCASVGVFLVLRRMSLMGDALSHSILPGVSIGFMMGGLSLPLMSIGGLVAGLCVALLAGLVTRLTDLHEDASFAGFFLISLALGVLMISMQGTSVDLIHVLFGSILGVDNTSLVLITSVATITILVMAVIYRGLVLECFDPIFFRVKKGHGGWIHAIFLCLVVANLVVGFQTLGTLMSLGLMMIPAVSARFWVRHVPHMCVVATVISIGAGGIGLWISYHANVPSGPAIILTAGLFYIVSLCVGPVGGMMRTKHKRRVS